MVPPTLITTYLQMLSPEELNAGYVDGTTIQTMTHTDLAFYRFLYIAVGEQWHWRDRLLITDDELHAILADPRTEVNVLYTEGAPAGFIELFRDKGEVEIAYFGLRGPFMGRGLGKHLLSWGVERAWQHDPERVWLHTCNLDGPHARDNYTARGFKVYEETSEPMPERYF